MDWIEDHKALVTLAISIIGAILAATAAPAPATVAMATSLRNYRTIQFVDGSETIAYIGFALPDDYDSGSPNVDLQIH